VGRDLGSRKLGTGPGHGHGQGPRGRASVSPGLPPFPLPIFLRDHKVMSKLGCPCLEQRGGKSGTREGQEGGGKATTPTPTHTHTVLSPHSCQGPQAGRGQKPRGNRGGVLPARTRSRGAPRPRQRVGAPVTISPEPPRPP
jgi:hypothetical protein